MKNHLRKLSVITASAMIFSCLGSSMSYAEYISGETGRTHEYTSDITEDSSNGLMLYTTKQDTVSVTGNVTGGQTSGGTDDDSYYAGLSFLTSNQNTVSITGNVTATDGDGIYLSIESDKNTIDIGGNVSSTTEGIEVFSSDENKITVGGNV
ncbi:MAG: hypothetical protein Q4E57_06790 [Eubacteriales bacterium]|nr:hypothetical protein [Eubacteriales bacterium]